MSLSDQHGLADAAAGLGDDESVFSPERIEAGRRLFAGSCEFLKGVARLDQLPEPSPVEIAFAGRSNVGKSSLLNTLTGRKTLARTSNTPGRTRELNFFTLGPALRLVDMPGYGYARADKALVKRWQEIMRAYLMGRAVLKRVFILIDARHGIKPPDVEMMDRLDEAAVSYQIVLTKTDKVRPVALERILRETVEAISKRPAAHPRMHATSSLSGAGIAELRAEIAALQGQ